MRKIFFYLPCVIVFSGLFVIWGCEDHTIDIPQGDANRLFEGSKSLTVAPSLEGEFLSFGFGEVDCRYALIALLDERPIIANGKLVNNEAIIWQWQDAVVDNQTVTLANGEYAQDQPVIDIRSLQCQLTELYWVAWGWEEETHRITHSTSTVTLLSLDIPQPVLTFTRVEQLGDSSQDTLLTPGEETQLRLDFVNTGGFVAEGIQLNLRGAAISDLPANITLMDAAPGQATSAILSFTVPPSLRFGDSLAIELNLQFNDCLESQTILSVLVNGSRVCLTDVRLVANRTRPSFGIWDFPAIPPDGPEADPYFLVFAPGIGEIFQSTTIDDVVDRRPEIPYLADWPTLVPCIPLAIDSTYTIGFWDRDSNFDDEVIGNITIEPILYLQDQLTTVTISTVNIDVELDFEWQ